MKIYTLIHIADWEGGVSVYTSEADLWARIKEDAEEAAERTLSARIPRDPNEWVEFINENGWKVTRYDYETHNVEPVPDVPFDFTPAPAIRCGTCGVEIEQYVDDPPTSWYAVDSAASYVCTKTADHAPATMAEVTA